MISSLLNSSREQRKFNNLHQLSSFWLEFWLELSAFIFLLVSLYQSFAIASTWRGKAERWDILNTPHLLICLVRRLLSEEVGHSLCVPSPPPSQPLHVTTNFLNSELSAFTSFLSRNAFCLLLTVISPRGWNGFFHPVKFTNKNHIGGWSVILYTFHMWKQRDYRSCHP